MLRPGLNLHFGWQCMGPKPPPVHMVCCCYHFLLLQQGEHRVEQQHGWPDPPPHAAIAPLPEPVKKSRGGRKRPFSAQGWSMRAVEHRSLCATPSVPSHTCRFSLTKEMIQKCLIALHIFSLRQQGKAIYGFEKKKTSSSPLLCPSITLLCLIALPSAELHLLRHRINGLISLFSLLFVLDITQISC